MSPGESDLIPRITVRDDKDRETLIQALALHIADVCDIKSNAHAHNRHDICSQSAGLVQAALELLDELDPKEENVVTSAAKMCIALAANEEMRG